MGVGLSGLASLRESGIAFFGPQEDSNEATENLLQTRYQPFSLLSYRVAVCKVEAGPLSSLPVPGFWTLHLEGRFNQTPEKNS